MKAPIFPAGMIGFGAILVAVAVFTPFNNGWAWTGGFWVLLGICDIEYQNHHNRKKNTHV